MDSALRSYLGNLDVVTRTPGDPDHGPVVLVRPDGHVAARGRPGRIGAVTGYLHDPFAEPALAESALAGSRPAGEDRGRA
jgi:hypothetical protein